MKDTQPVVDQKGPMHINEKMLDVRVPKDFIFLLMDKIVYDLAERPRASGDMPILSHPDVDLSEVKKAIRSRNLPELLKACKPFSAQCIAEKWAHEPEIAFALYQLHTLLKKFPLSGSSCAQKAYENFVAYESHCDVFNKQNYRVIEALNENHPDYLGFLEDIRGDIRRCIGDTPNLARIYDSAKHGPGTAVGLQSPAVTPYFKWSTLPYTVSPKALPYARAAIEADPRWIGALIDRYRTTIGEMYMPIDMDAFWSFVFKPINYCKYSTVPKSAETDRSIGIEPCLNVYLQLGVDGLIRRRLKHRWGIDLNTQSVNQKLAWQSSCNNEDATIDLKGASDCVAMRCGYMLLPPAWFDLLCDLRSWNIKIPKKFTSTGEDEIHPLRKLSAMGNGFTFVLETLIFAAICRVTMRRANIKGNLAVYGDDIVVPRIIAPTVIKNLGYFGFDVNVDKTFISGPFRESCGVDCLNGINIRPLFLKRPVSNVTDIWYISNSLFVLEHRLPDLWEVSFCSTREWLYKYIPRNLSGVYGPPSESLDTYLFIKRARFDHNGSCKHKAIMPIARCFNNRAEDWFFRKLMHDLRGPMETSLYIAADYGVPKIFGMLIDGDVGYEIGGARFTLKVQNGSAFDVTLRGLYEYKLVKLITWRK